MRFLFFFKGLLLYDINLRTAKTERESFAPTRISAVDLLMIFSKSSNSFTRKEKKRAKLLQDQSQAHLVDEYLGTKPPKLIETITLDMSAPHESTLDMYCLSHTYI